MKFILLFISILIINVNLYAGAPAPSSALPEPPYTFKKGTLAGCILKKVKQTIIITKEY